MRDGKKQHRDEAGISVGSEQLQAFDRIVDIETAELPHHVPAKRPDPAKRYDQLQNIGAGRKGENKACAEEGDTGGHKPFQPLGRVFSKQACG